MAAKRVQVTWLRGNVAVGQQEDGASILLDRPRDRGGQGWGGMNGGHLMLIGLATCLQTSLAAVAESRAMPFDSMTVKASAEDTTNPYRYGDIQVDIEICTALDTDSWERALEAGRAHSQVSNTLARACSLAVVLRITPPES